MNITKRLCKTAIIALCLGHCSSLMAQGIAAVNATQEILPSNYYSNAAWEAKTYVVNYGVFTQWGREKECQGAPDNDSQGRAWYEPAYELTNADFEWEDHQAPFYSGNVYNNKPAYQWTVDNNVADIYIRRSFTLDEPLPEKVYLAIGHDDGVSEFYINGVLVMQTDTHWDNSEFMELPKQLRSVIKTDGTENLFAVHVHNNYGGAYADCGIYGVPDEAVNTGNLAMGYEYPWTARLLFNSEGGYNYLNNNEENPIHGWSPLFEASADDVYTIAMPTAAVLPEYGIVQFKTPITIDPTHKYTFRCTVTADKDVDDCEVFLTENDNDYSTFGHSTFSLVAGTAKSVSISNVTGVSIEDLKLDFRFPTLDENTTITISSIKLRDQTLSEDIWDGTSYYNYCYYFDIDQNTRVKDMDIQGRTETLSWADTNFDDSMWQEAEMPIGNWGYMNEVRTIWPGGDNTNYWIRRNFTIDKVDPTSQYLLKVCHDDTYRVYVNGHLVDSDLGWTDGKNYVQVEIPSRYLNNGENVIATYIQQNWGGKFYDCGLTVTPDYYEDADVDFNVHDLVLNEICVDNVDQKLDYSYNYGGWIELYNKSDKRISLDDLYISDDAADLRKFQMPLNAGVVPAGGYRCIFFDHNIASGVYNGRAERQVDFKLNTAGGHIYISDYDGNIITDMAYPEAITRVSYARKATDSNEWQYNGNPTPEEVNDASAFASNRLNEPVVDTNARFFTEPFTVSVSIPSGATLRYTTNGTTPTLTNGEVSNNGKFDITENTTLRLRLFQNGMLPSKVVTRSYLYRDRDYYLPVVSVVTDRENLYNDEYGVYTTGTNGVSGHGISYASNKNMDWERPVNFEFFDADGNSVINQEATFYISGGYSRHWGPASFKIKAEKQYEGLNSLDYTFFDEKPYNKNKVLLFRNGGNDNNNRSKDAMIQHMVQSSGMYVDGQAYYPVHIFLNGQYLTMLNMREPSNKHYASANYGYDNDYIDVHETVFQKGTISTTAGDEEALNHMFEVSAEVAEGAPLDELRNIMDIDEYINYMATETYIGLEDWLTSSNNFKCFRNKEDGRYHFVQYDLDSAFDPNFVNLLIRLRDGKQNKFVTQFNQLMQNPELARQFVDAYCLAAGSVFTPDRAVEAANYVGNLAQNALAFEGKSPWGTCNDLKNKFGDTALRDLKMGYLKEYFNLEEDRELTFQANIPDAQFTLNNQHVPTGKFSGIVFGDVNLCATSPAGYNFVGWSATESATVKLVSKGDEWEYYDQGSLDDNPYWTTTDTTPWAVGNAPLGYNKSGLNTVVGYGGNEKDKYPTTYFRKDFELDAIPSSDATLQLRYVVDDGFVVYINGQEVGRYLMPEGDINFSTYAAHLADTNPDSGVLYINSSLLKKGKNRIAVEVHNQNPSSTDIYWDGTLVLNTQKPTGTISDKRELLLNTSEDLTLMAVFEPIENDYRVYDGATPVVINEVSAGNTIYANEYYKRNDWIELYNTTDEDIDLTGLYLSDDENKPHKYQLTKIPGAPADENIIPAHGYKIIWADKLDPLYQFHATFKLGNADGECVILTAKDDSWSDKIEYMAHTGEQSVGRYPDGGRQVYKMDRPTIAAQNFLTSYAEWISGEDKNFNADEYFAGITNPQIIQELTSGCEYYTIDGIRLNALQKGINIVRFPDGSIKKVYIK